MDVLKKWKGQQKGTGLPWMGALCPNLLSWAPPLVAWGVACLPEMLRVTAEDGGMGDARGGEEGVAEGGEEGDAEEGEGYNAEGDEEIYT